MLRSLNAGVSGLQQFQQKLDVIGNNIANASTTGYKAARAEFEDAFSQSLSGGGQSPIQVGSGVATASISSRFTSGNFERTGIASNMTIEGDGFFIVRDAESNRLFATRAGNFTRSNEGFLVNPQGYRLQGWTDPGKTVQGDIQIDDVGKPEELEGAYKNFNVGQNGEIKVHLSSGNSFLRAQVLLQRFNSPNQLVKEGNSLYSGLSAAGGLPESLAPDSNGLGKITPEGVESSNVDLAAEFASLIGTQRGFQASARIITTSDEVLQELVNLKR
jgi:flagellar hook protein FlgE